MGSSSRSPTTMSSNELPRTPSPVPLGTEKTDDSSGQSTTVVSSGMFLPFVHSPPKPCHPRPTDRKSISALTDAASTEVDPEFLANHLKPAPRISDLERAEELLCDVRKAENEFSMYKPAGEALTIISEKFYGAFPSTACTLIAVLITTPRSALIEGTSLKTDLLKRHRYLRGKLDSPIVFLDHHGHAPVNFPDRVLDNVRDAPDLLAVFHCSQFTQGKDGSFKGVPHHRVISIVEAKSKKKGGGRAQAASYAYRHQQARPDHPMVYCLVIKPQWYQVLLSSPNGIVASEQTSWDNLDLLFAYVYSHYDPRDDHFLDDDTLRWEAPANTKDAPSWKIKFQGKTYHGSFVFIGDPWGRRTTVFRATNQSAGELIFKDQYRHNKRRFKEEEVLQHIHAEGDIPGVVRLQSWEYVHTGGKLLQIGSGDDARKKVRLAFYDDGEPLRKAESINDLLRAFYDVLEGEFYAECML